MELGIQLFGVLAGCSRAPAEVFSLLKETGYTFAEPCFTPVPLGGWEREIWGPEAFEENMGLLRGLGLRVRSVHLFGPAPHTRAEQLKALAEKWGLSAYVVKLPENPTPEILQETAISWMTLADALTEAGVSLLIHNEAADISARIGGETLCEYMLSLCQGRVGLQADVGWVLRGGEDPLPFLRRNRALVRSVHFKDFGADGTPVTVGEGVLPLADCLAFARANGLPQIVDQDSFTGDPFADLAAVRKTFDGLADVRERTASYLNVVDTETGEVRTLARFGRVIEAPNWMRTTGELLYNSGGLLWAWKDGRERKVDTGACDSCNNDHVLSPAEDAVAVSHMTFGGEEGFTSRIYIVPFDGSGPRLVTEESPSFLHGWSPDGEEMAYCAFRTHGGRREVDIYTIPASGGAEKRLTDGGFNDGPEYSPDGKHIWFNSTRSGLMQVWRMNRDGSAPVRMTRNPDNCWFGHVSPDGKQVVYILYHEGHLKPEEHLPNMQCELWLMDADGNRPHRLCSFFGGQGSINVNSWAPDSRHLAFVSYEWN